MRKMRSLCGATLEFRVSERGRILKKSDALLYSLTTNAGKMGILIEEFLSILHGGNCCCCRRCQISCDKMWIALHRQKVLVFPSQDARPLTAARRFTLFVTGVNFRKKTALRICVHQLTYIYLRYCIIWPSPRPRQTLSPTHIFTSPHISSVLLARRESKGEPRDL